VTAYTYAYFLAALLSTVTAATIGFVTMPDLVADLERRPAEAARAYVRAVSPVGVFLYVPLAAAVATFGRPVLDAVLDGPLTTGTVDVLWDLLRLFLAAVLAWVLLTPVPTLALALGRFRTMAVLAVASLPVHVLTVGVLGAVGGTLAVAAGHALTTIALPIALAFAVFGRGAPRMLGSMAWLAAPPVALAAVFPLLAWLVPGADGVVAALTLSVAGGAAYLGAAWLLWPPARRLIGRVSSVAAAA
jgi:hypothetical protein